MHHCPVGTHPVPLEYGRVRIADHCEGRIMAEAVVDDALFRTSDIFIGRVTRQFNSSK